MESLTLINLHERKKYPRTNFIAKIEADPLISYKVYDFFKQGVTISWMNFFAFSRRAIAECKSAAWKMAAAFSTLIDCNILFSHIVLSLGIQKRSAASNNSMAQSKYIRS